MVLSHSPPRVLRPRASLLSSLPASAGVKRGTSRSIKPREPGQYWRLIFDPIFYEANGSSSTCHLHLRPRVETSAPPLFFGRVKGYRVRRSKQTLPRRHEGHEEESGDWPQRRRVPRGGKIGHRLLPHLRVLCASVANPDQFLRELRAFVASQPLTRRRRSSSGRRIHARHPLTHARSSRVRAAAGS